MWYLSLKSQRKVYPGDIHNGQEGMYSTKIFISLFEMNTNRVEYQNYMILISLGSCSTASHQRPGRLMLIDWFVPDVADAI